MNGTTGAPVANPVTGMLPGITYTGVNYTMTHGVAITTITPAVTGTITGCSSAPALPVGLAIDPVSCAISGTPTATQAATNHIIIATNVYGSGQTTIVITVPLRALLQFDFTNGSLVNSGSEVMALSVQEAVPIMTAGKDGDTNGGYLYNANNQYFTTAGVAGLPIGANPRTMCAWINPSSLPAVGVHHMAIRYGDILGVATASVLGISNVAGVQKISFIGSSYDAYADYTLPVNAWSHLCATFNGSTASLYVNGTFIASPPFTGTGPLNTTSTSFVIGTWGGSGYAAYYWRGILDDVRIYNVALSATQIGQIFSTGMTY